MMIALRLARAGWFGGDPERVLRGRVDIVLAALQYDVFRDRYERAYLDLNKERA